jgi:hypothetical protein
MSVESGIETYVVDTEHHMTGTDVRVFGIEPFDSLKPAHRSLNDHVPDICPECIKLGTWCDSSRAISKRTPCEFDKTLLRLVQSPPPKWRRCNKGLEIFLDPTQWRVPDANDGSLEVAAFRECSTRRYRISLTPINFLFPTGKKKLVLEKSIQSGLLLRHKPPQRLNTFSDVLTALNFAVREKVSGRDEGAWYNRVVDLFLRADEFATPQWEGGFLRFSFFRPAAHRSLTVRRSLRATWSRTNSRRSSTKSRLNPEAIGSNRVRLAQIDTGQSRYASTLVLPRTTISSGCSRARMISSFRRSSFVSSARALSHLDI